MAEQSQRLLEAFGLVDKFCADPDAKELTLVGLGSTERKEIHTLTRERGIFANSVPVGKSGKKMVLTKKIPDDFKIDENVIEVYSLLSRVPVPVFDPMKVEYYKALFRPFYKGVDEWWDCVIKDVTQTGKSTGFKQMAWNVCSKVVSDMMKKPEYRKLCNMAVDPVDFGPNLPLYKKENSGKKFVSVDVKSANFTVLRTFAPALFNGITDWKQFIGKYTKYPSIIESKYLREKIFGDAKLDVIFQKLVKQFIKPVVEYTKACANKGGLKFFSAETDEVVLEVVSDDFKFDEFQKAVEEKWPNTFHIKQFALKAFGALPDDAYMLKSEKGSRPEVCFVKEYPDGFVEFKTVPSLYRCQYIKEYLKQEIVKNDLYFIMEGRDASFDKPIRFGQMK
jgi:hypothetical protein